MLRESSGIFFPPKSTRIIIRTNNNSSNLNPNIMLLLMLFIVTILSQASAPTCGMPSPSSASQWLYAAVPQDSTSVKLYFTDAGGSYDHYVVEYGLSSGNYIFGLDNAGGKGTRTVTINLLLP